MFLLFVGLDEGSFNGYLAHYDRNRATTTTMSHEIAVTMIHRV
jgi:hypothetical protein